MALTNLETAVDGMSDADLIPTDPPAPPDNTWDPGVNAIRRIIRDFFVPGFEAKTPRTVIFRNVISIAYNDFNRVITRAQLNEIWQRWRQEVAERTS